MATAPKPAAKTPAKGGKGAAAPVVEDDGADKAKKKKRLLIAGGGVLALSLAGAGAFFFMKKKAAKEEADDANGDDHGEPEKAPMFMVLEPFTVNLRSEGNGSEQFLQASFNLQINDQKQADQLKLYMPQLRSRMLLLLSSKTPTEISTAEGKQELVDELAKVISEPYVEHAKKQAVIGVFITTFVIQ